MPARPISPHLSVYKMSRYSLATSILNRFAGVALSIGLLLLVYWLMSVAGGAGSQARATQLLSLPAMKLVYGGCIAAYCYHLVAGLRHLVWDTGRGLERSQSQKSAYLVVAVSIGLTLLIAYLAFVLKGHAP